MTRIFIFGASTVYGVGGEHGGWADLIKQEFHKKMFGEDGIGEEYEVYNFGRPGATSEFVMQNMVSQLSEYRGKARVISIISVGGNDAKAIDEPTNFVSTPEEYRAKMMELLQLLQTESDAVIAVGGGYYDETKTNPVVSSSGNSYFFTNKRKKLFEQTFKKFVMRETFLLLKLV